MFHYIPLHSAPAGLKYGGFRERPVPRKKVSGWCVCPVLWTGAGKNEFICEKIKNFTDKLPEKQKGKAEENEDNRRVLGKTKSGCRCDRDSCAASDSREELKERLPN